MHSTWGHVSFPTGRFAGAGMSRSAGSRHGPGQPTHCLFTHSFIHSYFLSHIHSLAMSREIAFASIRSQPLCAGPSRLPPTGPEPHPNDWPPFTFQSLLSQALFLTSCLQHGRPVPLGGLPSLAPTQCPIPMWPLPHLCQASQGPRWAAEGGQVRAPVFCIPGPFMMVQTRVSGRGSYWCPAACELGRVTLRPQSPYTLA